MIVLVPIEPAAVGQEAAEFVLAISVVGALIVKEAVTSVPDERGVRFGRVLDVALAPLLLAFAIVLVFQLLP